MTLEACGWDAPASVLLRLPFLHSQVTVCPVASLQGCAVIPLCHFQSFFDVLALCSHLRNFSGIWLLVSFQHRQWYNLCFSVPFSLLHPRHFFSSDQPISNDLLHPTPIHNKPSHHITVLTCQFFINFSWKQSLDRIQPKSFFQLLTFVFGCPLSPMYRHGLSRKLFLYILGRPLSCPPPPVLQTSKCASVAT